MFCKKNQNFCIFQVKTNLPKIQVPGGSYSAMIGICWSELSSYFGVRIDFVTVYGICDVILNAYNVNYENMFFYSSISSMLRPLIGFVKAKITKSSRVVWPVHRSHI